MWLKGRAAPYWMQRKSPAVLSDRAHTRFLKAFLFDSSSFHIVSLFVCMSDGECLSWVCSIFHHVREEVVFGDIWKDESEVALFLSQIYSYIYAVDVIHFAFLLFQHLVDDQLYGSCSNGLLSFLYIVDDEL